MNTDPLRIETKTRPIIVRVLSAAIRGIIALGLIAWIAVDIQLQSTQIESIGAIIFGCCLGTAILWLVLRLPHWNRVERVLALLIALIGIIVLAVSTIIGW